MQVVIVSGGFDPIHSGHIKYFKEAAKLGDTLVVALNSDKWLKRKKGQAFMTYKERKSIIRNLQMVDEVIEFNDEDGTANDAIARLLARNQVDRITFANGGDQIKRTSKEFTSYGKHPRVVFQFGIGGTNKKNSSSWILDEWKHPKTKRKWGYYRILHEDSSNGHKIKCKELTVNPGCSLSMQKHKKRSEHWFISEGDATVFTINKASTDAEIKGVYNKFSTLHIEKDEWHMLVNSTKNPLKIVEIQYGSATVEEDIERVDVSIDDVAILGQN